jgi:hypothetical protein
VGHLASALFFTLVLAGSIAAMYLMVKGYWAEIVAALKGEMPTRIVHRPWSGTRVRQPDRARPVVVAVRASRPPLRAAF